MRLGGSGRTQINQMVLRQDGRQRFFFRSAAAYAYLTTADTSNLPLMALGEKEDAAVRVAPALSHP